MFTLIIIVWGIVFNGGINDLNIIILGLVIVNTLMVSDDLALKLRFWTTLLMQVICTIDIVINTHITLTMTFWLFPRIVTGRMMTIMVLFVIVIFTLALTLAFVIGPLLRMRPTSL